MRSLRSQVTVFIIIGIVILLGIGTAVYYGTMSTPKTIEYTARIDPTVVNTYLNSVLTTATYDSIGQIALQGGEFRPSIYKEYALTDKVIQVSYALKENRNLIASRDIPHELSESILQLVKERIDLSFIEEMGGTYSIDGDTADVAVILSSNKVIVKLHIPVEIRAVPDTSYILTEVETEVPVDLSSVYADINSVIEKISSKGTPYNLTEDDYSCDLVRMCYLGNNIITIRQYKPLYNKPGLLLFVALDSEPILNSCTRLDRINNVNGERCP
jgi:hypothetical protein